MFIDELTRSVIETRPPDHNAAWTDFVVAGLLECLDGFAELDGVVHERHHHLDKIDAAIRRPGRFDQVLTLRLPTPELLTSVFRWHLRGDLAHVDLEVVTRRAIRIVGGRDRKSGSHGAPRPAGPTPAHARGPARGSVRNADRPVETSSTDCCIAPGMRGSQGPLWPGDSLADRRAGCWRRWEHQHRADAGASGY
ncbi:hypothetical protein [Marivita cryptomonadis]|uniref:hypothetical protein n=1 Tax=Marivita cryptomonadis TaxID=505252 RepID=UPI00391BE52B